MGKEFDKIVVILSKSIVKRDDFNVLLNSKFVDYILPQNVPEDIHARKYNVTIVTGDSFWITVP